MPLCYVCKNTRFHSKINKFVDYEKQNLFFSDFISHKKQTRHKLKIVDSFGSNCIFFLTFAMSLARSPFGVMGATNILRKTLN